VSAEKLVRMANEIAAFFKPYPEAEAVAGIRNHIHAFWTAKMIAGLHQAENDGVAGIDPLVVAALHNPAPAPAPTAKEAAGPAQVGEIGSSDAG
jgi:formate dehydrogenase subunit delta